MSIRIPKTKKVMSVLLALILVLSSVPIVNAAGNASNLLTSSDFENNDTWGFVPGAGATAVVEAEAGGNKYLKLNGAGGGNRSIVKTLDVPTEDAEVAIHFDWKPGDVSTEANNSEILFSDVNSNPLFRLVKAGGTGGEIKYGIGSTGTDLTTTQPVTGVSTDESWLSVTVNFNFKNESVLMSVYNKDDDSQRFTSSAVDISSINYANSISKISVIGNRASGNTLGFITGLDNLNIYGSGEPAPNQGASNIASIVTAYDAQISVPKEVAKADILTFFPSTVKVELENKVSIEGVPIHWDSADYDPSQIGSYMFTGLLDVDGIPNAANGNNITASVEVVVAQAGEASVIAGYHSVYYSDFGDTVATTPVNWGFTTANATLSNHTSDLSGNSTPKLQYSVVNQSGGRVASKTFDAAVKGDKILFTFDWYPGKVNDKGNGANENGGEFRIHDSSNNVVFTINHTNNAPLTYYAGGQSANAAVTGMTNAETWYKVDVTFDLTSNEVTLKLTDLAANRSETYITSLTGISFDGSVAAVKLGGVRTSGNNLTWTSYLDNFGVYNVSIPDNTIAKVDKLPYYRVYVNEKTDAIDSIGLPNKVTVTLADNSKAEVNVSEWTAIGETWNAAKAGVYEFQGILDVPDELINSFNRSAAIYVYNRLTPPDSARQTEWLDRGVVALNSEDGIFVSWRLLADEYDQDVAFNIYRNTEKLNATPLRVTNYADTQGSPGDTYRVETLVQGKSKENNEATAVSEAYLSIPMQKPEGGITASGEYTYSVNDSSVGDLDGDGQYEVIVKWYPSNAIDSSQTAMTGPTIFDAYKLDGTLLWRINMGLNLTSGAHYNQFIVADFDGNGKSEFLIKTADATTVYGATNGMFDSSKVIDVIGNAEDNGKWVNDSGHTYGGPEYMTAFDGETGKVIDTIDYAFPLGDVASWGDTWHNRSDRFLAGLAYLDGVKPSAVFGRGYYERTTYVAYSLVDGKLQQLWTFDSVEEGRGGSLGYHSLATGDVDNDGFDEIIAGSLTLDQDGTILYAMDGEQGREKGSHGDALHVGAFDPDREGLHVIGVHEDPAVASLEMHDGATGETIKSFAAYVDAGRGLAANITSDPGYEFWGNAGHEAATGGGIYNVQGSVAADSFRDAGLSINFALYWDGDLLHELLDNTSIKKYNETIKTADVIQSFEGVMSSNGTKATPTLQADLLGDWREEVLLPTTDSSELRIFSTTIPTEYRMYTLMHDTVYRMGIAWQNTAYNQPPHIGFYLGEDIRATVLSGDLQAPKVSYTNKPEDQGSNEGGSGNSGNLGGDGNVVVPVPDVVMGANGSATINAAGKLNTDTQRFSAEVTIDAFERALNQARADANGKKHITVAVSGKGQAYGVQIPVRAISSAAGQHQLTITSEFGNIVLPSNMLEGEGLKESDIVELVFAHIESDVSTDKKTIEIAILVNGMKKEWKSMKSSIQISIPYTPTAQESKEHEHLVVIQINENGNRSPIYNGRYNPATGMMDFTINQSSQYVISYVHTTFSDLKRHSWAQKEIEGLASKGIINGTSAASFTPEANISRADFIILLVKTLGLQADVDGSFEDVQPSDYYYNAVGIAKKLGIAMGQDNGWFNPQAEITRQDMMVLTARALAVAQAGSQNHSTITLHSYLDRGDIAAYALESAAILVGQGLILGDKEKINPLKPTTRAEAAVFMYRIYRQS
ncbi:MAG: S-layer homology domain-containing protein [Candidatus Pristimantibacillus sp.]